MDRMNDILIIGAGPAALAIAVACAERGMTACCVAPAPEAPWAPRYGAWTDELEDLTAAACVAQEWGQTITFSPARLELGRSYCRLSTEGLQANLRSRCEHAGVRFRADTVTALAIHERYTAATLDSGATLPARVVIDATGHGGGFIERTGQKTASWQVAYGQLLHVPGGHPWSPGEMTLMDFRLPEKADSRWIETPTFLYVMPTDREHVFVEETSLIASRPPSLDTLAERLSVRLLGMGVCGTVLDEERCRIRMTGPAPVLGQQTLAYGAAAGMIHPATGYQLARVLREAPVLAEAIAQALDAGGPRAAAQAGWAALWPAERRRAWALYGFGAGILGSLDHHQTVAFFDAFFRLSPRQWQGFHSATLPPAGVASAMTAFFLNAPPSIRRLLVAAGASRSGASLLREVAWA
jgi:lycopene cyclase-like protein